MPYESGYSGTTTILRFLEEFLPTLADGWQNVLNQGFQIVAERDSPDMGFPNPYAQDETGKEKVVRIEKADEELKDPSSEEWHPPASSGGSMPGGGSADSPPGGTSGETEPMPPTTNPFTTGGGPPPPPPPPPPETETETETVTITSGSTVSESEDPYLPCPGPEDPECAPALLLVIYNFYYSWPGHLGCTPRCPDPILTSGQLAKCGACQWGCPGGTQFISVSQPCEGGPPETCEFTVNGWIRCTENVGGHDYAWACTIDWTWVDVCCPALVSAAEFHIKPRTAGDPGPQGTYEFRPDLSVGPFGSCAPMNMDEVDNQIRVF